MMEIALGSEVEDITTGFRGIVTNRTEYMNGCIQYFVEPPVDKKTHELCKGWHIDVQCLKVLSPGVSKEYPLNEVVVPLKAKRLVGGSRREKMKSKPN